MAAAECGDELLDSPMAAVGDTSTASVMDGAGLLQRGGRPCCDGPAAALLPSATPWNHLLPPLVPALAARGKRSRARRSRRATASLRSSPVGRGPVHLSNFPRRQPPSGEGARQPPTSRILPGPPPLPQSLVSSTPSPATSQPGGQAGIQHRTHPAPLARRGPVRCGAYSLPGQPAPPCAAGSPRPHMY
ncbi:hypothetical protein GQ55_5G512300 [Panicum hallii var. hallii]|uniref:Uncharacterized protein n=1 Tax=Panicum hallii var. hallii TaxID=1504633 RepID=A0A2T7DSD5_9POAL|nr:hypothetical protein GQ55_5G512300 [Panicum hallii var. hallii]